MKMFRDLILIAMIAAGGIGGSQIPQLVQEYEQRLGGARDEAMAAHKKDVEDAGAFGLSLKDFADRYRASDDAAIQSGADNMMRRRDRAEALDKALDELAKAPYMLRPWIAFQHLDPVVGPAAWQAFRPTLTIDPRFAVAGVLLGWICHALLTLIWRLIFSRPYRERRRFDRRRA
tara:strand:+ start:478 stop:1002 length:525 start_codon:yes stop_codon:yes gene_type:complete